MFDRFTSQSWMFHSTLERNRILGLMFLSLAGIANRKNYPLERLIQLFRSKPALLEVLRYNFRESLVTRLTFAGYAEGIEMYKRILNLNKKNRVFFA
jgi:hypothetical protein